jgi:hypothetical protein
LKKRGISKLHAETKMVVLMDLEDEDENNFCFLQELIVVTTSTSTSTSQPIAKFALLIVPSFSKLS